MKVSISEKDERSIFPSLRKDEEKMEKTNKFFQVVTPTLHFFKHLEQCSRLASYRDYFLLRKHVSFRVVTPVLNFYKHNVLG